jgi:hypothetical protein
MEIDINVLSPTRLVAKQEGRDMLQCLIDVSPVLIPDKYDYGEPIRENFDKDDIGAALTYWGRTFLWRRIKPRMNGSAWSTYGPRQDHSWIVLRINNRQVDGSIITGLTEAWASKFDADLSTIHLLCPGEIARGYDGRVVGHRIRHNLRDLYWTTIFGLPYIKLFGRERLLTCPAYSTRELSNGSVYIQLTPSIFDVEEDAVRFNEIRDAAKAHLDSNAFFSPDLPSDHVYNVPEFVMQP